MERFQKLELLQRSLGLRHKLKVHDSIRTPETHEELALMILNKWELEDELRAIDELLLEARQENVTKRRTQAQKEYLGPNAHPAGEKRAREAATLSPAGTKKKSKK